MSISGTKRLFADAFLSMTETKPINSITIQDLLEACGAARQTFYNHFRDKNDLICWIFTDAMDQILQCYTENNNLVSSAYDTYLMFIEHKAFYTKCIQMEGQNNLFQESFQYVQMYFRQYIQLHYGTEALNDSICSIIDFYCYGVVNICREWMKGGMQRPADEMADLMLRCLPAELKDFFPI